MMRTTMFQKYTAYKDSGVEWLGEIPEHWELLSNKNIFKLKKNQVGKKSADYTLLSLTLKGIINRVLEDGGKFPAEFDTYQEVKKGDFVFCLFDVEETPRCVGLSDFEGMITGAYTVMEVKSNFDRKFLYYFYLNLDADKRMRPLYTGLRNTISKDNFFAFKTFVPPLREQTAIAAFLDDKTAKIDLAIAQKEKMIALLKERKQIIIQNAVTKGLNCDLYDEYDSPDSDAKNQSPSKNQKNHSSRRMKHSGVEWIGEIPEGWDVKKLKYLGRIISGYAFPSDGFKSEGVRVMKISNIQTMNIDWSDESFVNEDCYSRLPQFQIKEGDLVFALTRPIISTGIKASIVPQTTDKILLNQRNAVLKPKSLHLKKWFYYVILDNGFKQVFNNQIDFTGQQPNISPNDIGNIEIPLPPIEEINTIVAHIETQSAKIDKAIGLQEQQIEKLKELKATLIDGAVTGKIKII